MGDAQEAVVAERVDAPWLPPGGRALVVRGGRAPAPMCLVRLLLRRADRVFCVPRDGAGKLDLPTRAVAVGDPGGASTLAELVADVTGAPREAHYVGAVRNVVDVGASNYPWPAPLAHFGVWSVDAAPVVRGDWVGVDAATSLLRDRHWFPLLHGSASATP